MFRLKYVSATVMALCAAGATPAWAQTTDTPAPETPSAAQKTLQRVEVTGSRIKRIDAETASPVQVITREQIDRSGAQSVTQLLGRLPASNAGNFNSNAVASFTPGAGGVSLRGLGSQSTLVLINGRRMAPYGFASGGQQSFFDINSIPLDVVERVEVLLDGASAIYGSDAIAGVINVILRKNYNGLSLSGSGAQSGYHDGESGKFSTTWGKGDLDNDKYNFFLNYSHEQQNSVKASQRPMTSSADFRRFGLNDLRSAYGYPGNLYDPATGAFLGPMPGCKPLNEPGAATNGRCYYQGTDHQDLVPETKQDALFGAGTLDLGGGFELFGDALFVRNKYKGESPSYNTGTYQGQGTLPNIFITLPANHPQNTTGADVGLRYRFMDVLHTTEVTADTARLVVGGRGTVAGWDAESALMFSGTRARVTTRGLINDSVLTGGQVVDANGVANPNFIFGNPGANDPALMAALYPTLRDEGKTSTTSIDLRGSRELMKLPAGGLGLALGVELRRESFKSTPDRLTATDQISVLGGASSDGSRNVSAIYAELSIPITKTFEASLATRTDHYSDFGSATVPKAGLKWKVLPNVALRATYAEGFRAPSLTETTQSPVKAFYTGIRDPKLCPDPNNPNPDPNPNCDLSLEALSGSNPNLKPEKSKSFTAGLVFEPSENVSLSFDAYKIKRRDEISSIDPDYLLANEANYPGYVVRNQAGEIDGLNLQYTNLGSTRIWGYDIELKARQDLGSAGRVGLTVVYNKMPRYLVANVKDAPEVDYAGTYNQPKERFKAGIDWDIGDWSTTLSGNYTGGFLRAFTPADLSCSYASGAHPDLCRVKAWSTADLFVQYKGFKNLMLSVNVDNIENREPPIDERLVTRYIAYNPGYHSQMGRTVTLAAKYTFW
ncbi:TonB-dependent receptor plug domain-containing protein [Rhizobacter sp. P5_C2]